MYRMGTAGKRERGVCQRGPGEMACGRSAGIRGTSGRTDQGARLPGRSGRDRIGARAVVLPCAKLLSFSAKPMTEKNSSWLSSHHQKSNPQRLQNWAGICAKNSLPSWFPPPWFRFPRCLERAWKNRSPRAGGNRNSFQPDIGAVGRAAHGNGKGSGRDLGRSAPNLAPVGASDNFIELGGDSLRGIQVLARLRQKFQVNIGVHALLAAEDLTDLAGQIQEAQFAGRETIFLRSLALQEKVRCRCHFLRKQFGLSASWPGVPLLITPNWWFVLRARSIWKC